MLALKKTTLLLLPLLVVACSLYAQELEHQEAPAFAKSIDSVQTQLIDVRTAAEYAEGHIAHATLIDWKDPEKFGLAIKKLDKEKPVYLYCRSGRRSTDAGNYLIQQGFKKVINLEGGIQAWQENEKVIVK